MELFNIYDYIFFVYILFFSFIGLVRGFWVQLFAVIIWLAAFAFYWVYAGNIEHVTLSSYMSPEVAHWFFLAVLLIGSVIINFIVRFLLGSVFKINPFTLTNKGLGFILGAIASGLIVLLIIYAVNSSSFRQESTEWEQSYLVKQTTVILANFKNQQHDDQVAFLSQTPAANE